VTKEVVLRDVSRLESSAVEAVLFQIRRDYGLHTTLTWGSGLFLRDAYIVLDGDQANIASAFYALSKWWHGGF
jgi:hypothetical protein